MPKTSGAKKQSRTPSSRLVDAPSQQVTDDEDWFDPPARVVRGQPNPDHGALLDMDSDVESEKSGSDEDPPGDVEPNQDPDGQTPIVVTPKGLKRTRAKPSKVSSVRDYRFSRVLRLFFLSR